MLSAAYCDQIWLLPFKYITKQKYLLIVIIQLMLSVKLSPKVITIIDFHCNAKINKGLLCSRQGF
jgi:hypothetical protein